MPDQRPVSPALSDATLRETLDLLGQVVASISARIDRQGERIEAMAETVTETHAAAERTQQQTNPALYGRFVGETVERALDAVLDDFARTIVEIRKEHEKTTARLKELEQAEGVGIDRLRQELADVATWRRRVPWIWAGAVVLGLGLAVFLMIMF